jgi:hypothetical protein
MVTCILGYSAFRLTDGYHGLGEIPAFTVRVEEYRACVNGIEINYKLYTQRYAFRLTRAIFIIVIFSKATCFDQADHHQVFIHTKA